MNHKKKGKVNILSMECFHPKLIFRPRLTKQCIGDPNYYVYLCLDCMKQVYVDISNPSVSVKDLKMGEIDLEIYERDQLNIRNLLLKPCTKRVSCR